MTTLSPQHHRVLDVAESLFSQFGYARVTTEEIARTSGVSKKTLYVLFPSKSDIILQACLRVARNVRDQYLATSFTDTVTYRSELSVFITSTASAMARLSARLFEDLRVHEPCLVRRIEIWQHVYLPSLLEGIIRSGHTLGIVRQDVHPGIAAAALTRVLLDVIHPDQRRHAAYVPRVETVIRVLLDGVIKP